MADWIDFKELRKRLDFAHVLGFYGVTLNFKQHGQQHVGPCPLPMHKRDRRAPSFSANLERGLFRCFGCQSSGNVMDFICMMEGLSPSDPASIRKTATFIVEKGLAGDPPAKPKPPTPRPAAPRPKEGAAPAAPTKTVANQPLDFELKGLDPNHPYLKQRGFHPETMSHFGVGFCTRGLFKGRIAIPLHDRERKLLGYAGRVVDDATINDDNPKYLFPPPRVIDGIEYEFRKNIFLYTPPDLTAPVEDLIVVQGFTSAWWLWQWNYRATVALMGSTCSVWQAQSIVEAVIPDGNVWIMTDGDEAGRICAGALLESIAPHRFCKWVVLETGQPTDLTPADLSKLLWTI